MSLAASIAIPNSAVVHEPSDGISTVYALANTWRKWYRAGMDEGRKRVIGIMAAILASLHMQTADDLFRTPQFSHRTDKLIYASIRWAKKIMDERCRGNHGGS